MRKIILLSVCMLITSNLLAQEDSIRVNISIEKWNKLELEKKGLIDSIKVLNNTLSHYRVRLVNDSIENESLTSEIDSLSLCLKKLQEKEKKSVEDSIKIRTDSLRLYTDYQLKCEQLDAKLKIAELKSARADTIAIQMMMTYLELKCTKEWIMELRQNFVNIPSDTLKREYQDIDNILALYTETRQKIVALAKDELKNKKIKSADSSLYQDIYIKEYRQQLDSLLYVKEYYKNEDSTSPYLNKMLNISYKALETKNTELLKEVMEL